MHWLDRAATLGLQRLAPSKRPFHLGWGEQDTVDWYIENARNVPPIPTIDPTLRPARRSGRTIVRDLEFVSPFEQLPSEVMRVRARWFSTDPEPERVVILHAAWNDEDYSTRTRFARSLLERGIGSVLLQHPFYGDRRRSVTDDSAVPFVSDFCLMGRGGVLEGRALAAWLHARGVRVGVAGYSMGGNIAGFVGTLVPFPVAISIAAAPYSAAPPFLHGLLRQTLAWDALGGENRDTEQRLEAVLDAGSLLDHTPPPHAAAAIIVTGTTDGFVPTWATQAIHRHWAGSAMRWVNAGHASLLLRRRDRIVDAIADSFDRIDALLARTGAAD